MSTDKPLCAACREAFIPLDGYDTHPSCDLPVLPRLYKRRARARWPKAEWIVGTGRYASVAHCRVLTVKLHEAREDAVASVDFIDRYGCGGHCSIAHELVDLGAP